MKKIHRLKLDKIKNSGTNLPIYWFNVKLHLIKQYITTTEKFSVEIYLNKSLKINY